MAILRKLQIWQEFIGLAKIKTRWPKRHVDNCGFYENDKFCEIGEFGFIKGLAKILNETTTEALLVCNHETRRPCWESIQYNFSQRINMKIELVPGGEKCFCSRPPTWPPWRQVQTSNIDSWRFHEIGKLRKWRIGQESIKGLSKTQMRWQRGESWQMAIIRKWQV